MPYALSTMGTTSIEDVAAAAPPRAEMVPALCLAGPRCREDLIERARAAGYEALMLTVDIPVAGPRLRDVRNGFSIPPSCRRDGGNALLHPRWWLNLLTTPR